MKVLTMKGKEGPFKTSTNASRRSSLINCTRGHICNVKNLMNQHYKYFSKKHIERTIHNDRNRSSKHTLHVQQARQRHFKAFAQTSYNLKKNMLAFTRFYLLKIKTKNSVHKKSQDFSLKKNATVPATDQKYIYIYCIY